MTDTNKQPTDAELRAYVRALIADDDGVRTNDEQDHVNLIRAALAKWGTPPAVAGEPVATGTCTTMAGNITTLRQGAIALDASRSTPPHNPPRCRPGRCR